MVAADTDSPNNILNALVDDCLLHIFSQLSLPDLYSVAHACQRFNGIAKETFESRYSRKGVLFVLDIEYGWPNTSLYQIESCLRTFGSEIRCISLSIECSTEILLWMCRVYCKRLVSLKLGDRRWYAGWKDGIRRLLPHLKHLDINIRTTERYVSRWLAKWKGWNWAKPLIWPQRLSNYPIWLTYICVNSIIYRKKSSIESFWEVARLKQLNFIGATLIDPLSNDCQHICRFVKRYRLRIVLNTDRITRSIVTSSNRSEQYICDLMVFFKRRSWHRWRLVRCRYKSFQLKAIFTSMMNTCSNT